MPACLWTGYKKFLKEQLNTPHQDSQRLWVTNESDFEITSGFIYPQKGLGQFWPLEPSSDSRFVVPSLSSKCLPSVSNDLAYYSGEEAEDTPLSPKH